MEYRPLKPEAVAGKAIIELSIVLPFVIFVSLIALEVSRALRLSENQIVFSQEVAQVAFSRCALLPGPIPSQFADNSDLIHPPDPNLGQRQSLAQCLVEVANDMQTLGREIVDSSFQLRLASWQQTDLAPCVAPALENQQRDGWCPLIAVSEPLDFRSVEPFRMVLPPAISEYSISPTNSSPGAVHSTLNRRIVTLETNVTYSPLLMLGIGIDELNYAIVY